MKCILMNKNIEVLVLEYDEELKVFSKIYEVKNIDYAPIILKNSYEKGESFKYDLTEWFKGRGIPSWREDLELLLSKLDVSTSDELLNKAFGLSLSDQYFLKPYDSKIEHKDINFFDNDFETAEFVSATFGNDFDTSTKISLISPNNTTDGRLKKTWIIENNKRYLLKGGYKFEVMQPFNEALASMICERLGFFHVPYTIDIINNKVVSKCPCFINFNTELIPAHQILHNNVNKDNAYEEYISLLEKKGIKDARKNIENMFILDYIIMNEDRHLNNFGIIRNVETLEWISVAPIFDNGQSLNILDYNNEEILINGNGRFFYKVNDFDSMISHIKNLKRFDLSLLDDVVEEFEKLLHKYTSITHMTDRRIEKICTLLYSRIQKLKRIIEN